MRQKAYEELGKTSLTIAVAFVVFTVIKPFSEGKTDWFTVGVGLLMFSIFLTIGVYLINKGGSQQLRSSAQF